VSYDCDHWTRRLVWAEDDGHGNRYARRQLREQCLDCGWLLGEQKAHRLATSTTPSVDKIALKNCVDARRRSITERSTESMRAYDAKRAAESAKRWVDYNDHLASEEWRQTRKIVFKRDDHICQGCLKRPATQVHHLTYRNVCNEFAFQLVAICDECHDRYHARAS
jgi:5-methylcytosine-specific restriction endonuclease McrA